MWALTSFQLTNLLGKVDSTVQWKDGVDGPFIALGEAVCADRYILMEAHVVSRSFCRAPLSLKADFEYPHMTLAKLEYGNAERKANTTIWTSYVEGCVDSVDMTGVIRRMNERLKMSGVLFRLIPAYVDQDQWSNRYNITGGEALQIFRRLQDELLLECECLGEGCVNRWSEHPAKPHISYEYRDDEPGQDWDMGSEKEEKENGAAAGGGSGSASARSLAASSNDSSLQAVLSRLAPMKLEKLRSIFVRERLSSSVVSQLSDAQLAQVGISRLGDRVKVRRLAEELPTSRGRAVAGGSVASADGASARGE